MGRNSTILYLGPCCEAKVIRLVNYLWNSLSCEQHQWQRSSDASMGATVLSEFSITPAY